MEISNIIGAVLLSLSIAFISFRFGYHFGNNVTQKERKEFQDKNNLFNNINRRLCKRNNILEKRSRALLKVAKEHRIHIKGVSKFLKDYNDLNKQIFSEIKRIAEL